MHGLGVHPLQGHSRNSYHAKPFMLPSCQPKRVLTDEKLLFDPKSQGAIARRVMVSDSPTRFAPAFTEVGRKILAILAKGPGYPAEIARELKIHHQTVYYHVGRLEKSGLVTRLESHVVRGGRANVLTLSSDGYAVEFDVKGEALPSISAASRSRAFGNFFNEFVESGAFSGWIVVGSPSPHGPRMTVGRDGHYAVQLGFALGQFVRLPNVFPVKLDVDIRAEKLERSNMIIVGGPRTNVISAEINKHLPIRFSDDGSWSSISDDRGRVYESDFDCMVVKGPNPWDESRTCVICAGVTGAGTKAGILALTTFVDDALKGYKSGRWGGVLRGTDLDGDGKVDSVETLRRL